MNEDIQTTTERPVQNESVFASLGLNVQLFIFQLINFGLLVLILWFLILRPLTKKMEERRQKINESLDKAKEVETNLAMSEQRYQERIDEAKVEARSIAERGYAEAEALAETMKQKAKKDIQLLIDQAKRNIQIESAEAMQAVKLDAANLIVEAVRKVLPQKLVSEQDKELVEDALKGFKR